ncbi:Thg1-domain-containing protein [Aaosphaeria arxii CBS 175.79]|uniref:tRNA(His) guanylyltransferase n=1 Tax=Aaosphaeria arxii CBS 175.79 TaxID=1450172 RepID=A0A6A5XXH5_9PLEO|nr:Thg1-domain-containing protein [Aaosphaeria arxii CBS 175.79]KAF2017659.1 Thg1-domain-containing protein [Aaosphaeria arxii CBS 175.79]
MANSKYEYVRDFEETDRLLPGTWIVVRIDGRGFTKFTTRYQFEKPNDRRALDLMNAAAEAVMKDLPDIVLAYGDSDEFSFVFHKNCTLFERRASKLMTTIVSTFTANYTFLWSTCFPDSPLAPPLPSFDGRCVCYPSDQYLRDYMSWRQVDCHINNLYNTTFWALVNKGNMQAREAEELLKGTVSSDKNEILFSRFGINYNNEPEIFRKGSVLYRDFFEAPAQVPAPSVAEESTTSPPLSHPRPQRTIRRPMSQPIERPVPDLRASPLSDSTIRGPTFLSTSTTPSPPPSPQSLSIPAFSNPFAPPTTETATMPTNGGHSHSNSTVKSPLPQLTPLPLPPPTLKPSTKPPPFLNPPNSVAHTNTSPQPSPQIQIPDVLSERSISNSSKPIATSSRPVPSADPPRLKHRSPSLSMIDYTAKPPIIPLRISSIPIDNRTRKLSLPSSQKSALFNHHHHAPSSEKDKNLSTMKELPIPPSGGDDIIDLRNKVMAGELRLDSLTPANPASRPGSRLGVQDTPPPPPPPPPPEQTSTGARPDLQQRARSHPRLRSAPPTATTTTASTSRLPSPPALSNIKTKKSFSASPPPPSQPQQQPPPSSSSPAGASKPNSGKAKAKAKAKAKVPEEEGGWAAATKEPSRTQREKERKKRTKARIVIEHVDVIKDEFWIRRPWILTGKAGL